ncbi:hypothetical protein PCE1_004033 [Barthelona sp. PCE]
MSCIFCKIIEGQIPSYKVFENDEVFAFLDINPLKRGHMLVIPKVHSETLNDITLESLNSVMAEVKRIGAIFPSYKLEQRNGRASGQEVDHVHFHIIPSDLPFCESNDLAEISEAIQSKI